MHKSLPFRSLESRQFTLQIHHRDIRGGSVATLRLLVWWLGNKLHSQGKAFFSRSHFNWICPCCSSWHNNTKGLESLKHLVLQHPEYSTFTATDKALKCNVLTEKLNWSHSFKCLPGASISKCPCMKENFTPWLKNPRYIQARSLPANPLWNAPSGRNILVMYMLSSPRNKTKCPAPLCPRYTELVVSVSLGDSNGMHRFMQSSMSSVRHTCHVTSRWSISPPTYNKHPSQPLRYFFCCYCYY